MAEGRRVRLLLRRLRTVRCVRSKRDEGMDVRALFARKIFNLGIRGAHAASVYASGWKLGCLMKCWSGVNASTGSVWRWRHVRSISSRLVSSAVVTTCDTTASASVVVGFRGDAGGGLDGTAAGSAASDRNACMILLCFCTARVFSCAVSSSNPSLPLPLLSLPMNTPESFGRRIASRIAR